MIKVQNSDILKIEVANDSVKGTTSYTQFLMETYSKVNGRWCFIGWHIPLTKLDGIVKTRMGISWLIIGDDKYRLSYSVKQILKL